MAKAITLVESKLPEHRSDAESLVDQILPHTGKSLRIGVSGAPGAGKSTFIEALGTHLTEVLQKKVCVLAVDPSSPVTGGSIMGDKTRMENLSQSPRAFIRPSPSGGALGGVAQKTREAMLLAEAAGFEFVIVETVGVGQSEVEVAGMVDFFIVLLLPSAGDELQGIKKGIIELADMLVINKADGDSLAAARRTQNEYQSALHLLKAEGEPSPVLLCSSLSVPSANTGSQPHSVVQVLEQIEKLSASRSEVQKSTRRAQQQLAWFHRLLQDSLLDIVERESSTRKMKSDLEAKVQAGQLSPITASRQVFTAVLKLAQDHVTSEQQSKDLK